MTRDERLEAIEFVVECTNHYCIKELDKEKMEIKIRIPDRFKSIWLAKIAALKTSPKEIECSNEPD